MTDRGVANSPLLIGFHNEVRLGLSSHCKLRLVLQLSNESVIACKLQHRVIKNFFHCKRNAIFPTNDQREKNYNGIRQNWLPGSTRCISNLAFIVICGKILHGKEAREAPKS